jgi:transposase
LVVAVEQLQILQKNLRTGTTQARVAVRSRILWLRADGQQPGKVAQQVGCDRATVWRVEERYRQRGLDALQDAPRPGRPPRISPPAACPHRRSGLPQA